MAMMNPFFGNFQQGLQNNSDLLLQTGLGLLGGRTPQEQVAGAAQAVSAVRQQNKTLDFLKNTNPQLAQAVASGALSPTEAYKFHLQSQLAASKPKNNYIAVGKNLYDAENNQWVTPPAGSDAESAPEYGLQPQYATDAQGNPVIVQLSKSGAARTAQLPDGVKLSKEPIKLDAGTNFILLDPITRQQIGVIPKDLAGAEYQKAAGRTEGEAVATAKSSLPQAEQAAADVASQVERLKNDKDLGSVLGPLDSRTPNWSSGANRVQSYIDQLGGGAFLQARTLLKGGGQITDFEGKKAEQAYIRLNQAQSEEDFKSALDDFNDAVQAGLKKLQGQAGGSIGPAAPGTVRRYNPQTGRIE